MECLLHEFQKDVQLEEFISGVLLVPAIVGFVWFSVFGVLGIETGKETQRKFFDMTPETQLFGCLIMCHLALFYR